MRISVLGPLKVTDDDGIPLDLKLEPKQQVVLLALAANADRGMPLHELVLAVYGSRESPLYKRSMESLVSRLRRTLKDTDPAGGDVLPPAKGGFYTTDLSADQVDSLRFLRLAQHLLGNWDGLPAPDRHALCRQALEEWRDDPVRIYAGTCPVVDDIFRRFTNSLAELGHRYVNSLLENQLYDRARTDANRLLDLLPGHSTLAHLRHEVDGRAAPTAHGPPASGPGGDGRSTHQELCDRLLAYRSLPFDAMTVTAHNLDRIYLVDRVAPDHEVTIQAPIEAAGGSGANTISALGRLGCSVAATGIVADDAEGHMLLSSLHDGGVDSQAVLVVSGGDDTRTGHSIVFSDPHGVRSIYVHPGVNESLAEASYASSAHPQPLSDCIRQSRIVHFTSFTAPAELRLQETLISVLPAQTVLSLNPGALYASLGLDRLDAMLSRVNVLFLYEQNLRDLVDNSAAPSRDTGQPGIRSNLERLYAWKAMKGYDQPLVTLVKRHRSALSGDPGAEYLTVASGRFAVEEILGTQARIGLRNSVPVKDSTGAGDGMAAGLLFGMLHGSSLSECADLAFLMATLVSDQVGARAGQPTPERLRAEWRSFFPGVVEPRCLDDASGALSAVRTATSMEALGKGIGGSS